jgi:glutamyl/glutaminyl-tRNA synthetase
MSHTKTRIAPSPTGRFHIGTARTALINYLFARHAGGQFVIRIEDTDKERSKVEYETEILEGLAWLGLDSDEFFRQTEQAPRHAELLQALVARDAAYVSREESKNEAGKMVEVVRLRNPGRSVTFRDEVRGDITFDTTELGDFVIARSTTDPLYHFAVVVDDWDEGITHVIRGEDHISNTTRQILIQEALGAPRPVYAHLPLILDEKRAKLSKRSGATSVMDYRAEGILPEALVNYLALLGWSPGNDREDFSLAELVAEFSLSGILSVNQRWMRKLPDEEFARQVHSMGGFAIDMLHKTVPLLKERARTFREAHELLGTELRCLFEQPHIVLATLRAKEPADRSDATREALAKLLQAMRTLPDSVTVEEARAALMPLADAEEAKGKGGRGSMLWPLRYALSGEERSPDPFTLIAILGTHTAIARVTEALAILG